MEGSKARVIENSEGDRTTPSVVALLADGSRLVGAPAKRQAVTNPAGTFYATKRLIGRRFSDPAIAQAKTSYKIIRGPNGDAWVQDKMGKGYSPSQIGAIVLQKMKETAESHLGKSVTSAVITVPAYFNDSQRQATKDAGQIAGLEVKRIINEPTAAALAYGLDTSKDRLVAVFDLGGGTFDISILEISAGVFQVKATNGDTFLGGEDFDARLVDFFIAEFKKQAGIDVSNDLLVVQRLKEAAEAAKIELSSLHQIDVNLPFLAGQGGVPKHLKTTVTRGKLESLVNDLVQRSIAPCKKCLKDANITLPELDEVILVGGMTRMPRVREAVRNFFGKEPFKGVNPDEAVAVGAAIQAGVLEGSVKDLLLLDVTPLSLGISIVTGELVKIIKANTTIPAKGSNTFVTVKDNQTEMDISVHQGERPMAFDNKLLGQFTLFGIPPAPKGVAEVLVTFEIDANGIVSVTARDKATGKEANIKLKTSGGLTPLQIEKMRHDAVKYAEADERRKKSAAARVKAEETVRKVDKAAKGTYKDILNDSDKKDIRNKIDAVKSALASSDSSDAEIASAAEALEALSNALFEAAYHRRQATKKA